LDVNSNLCRRRGGATARRILDAAPQGRFFSAAALGIRCLAAEQKVGGHQLDISLDFCGGRGGGRRGRQPEKYLMQPRRADFFVFGSGPWDPSPGCGTKGRRALVGRYFKFPRGGEGATARRIPKEDGLGFGLKSAVFGGRADPGCFKTIQKGWGRSPPPCWMVSKHPRGRPDTENDRLSKESLAPHPLEAGREAAEGVPN